MSRYLALVLCLLFPGSALAHVVTTTDGKKFEGRVTLENDQQVVIETTFDGKQTVPRADIKTVNKSVPPLRDQLAYRNKKAIGDAGKMWDLYRWAKSKGFQLVDTKSVLEQVIRLNVNHKKARKVLGHEKVDGTWMTPAQKKQHEMDAQAAEMRAKGLVPHEGRWISPEELNAIKNGLRKDGDDWVTEAEWRKRRGETQVHGRWIKMGLREGKKFHIETRASRVPLNYEWGPHFDTYFNTPANEAKLVMESAEKAFAEMRRVLKPAGMDFPEDGSARISLFLIKKLPKYVKFSSWFAKKYKVEEVARGWTASVRRQHAWWWVQEHLSAAGYQFPNTFKTFNSNVIHHLGHTLLTRYKMNYAFPKPWLLKGFSYYLEMKANGYTLTFSLGRGKGTVETGDNTDRPEFAESAGWHKALAAAVNGERDPPLKRIAKMGSGDFRYIELVKSWSVVDYLASADPTKFKKFIDLTKDTEIGEEAALKEAYGVGYRGIDKRWRAFVAAGFKHGAPAPAPVPADK